MARDILAYSFGSPCTSSQVTTVQSTYVST